MISNNKTTMDTTTTFYEKGGQSILSFQGAIDVEKGEVVLLNRTDHRRESPHNPMFNFDAIDQRRWKVTEINRYVEEIISDNSSPNENYPFPFKIRCNYSIDVVVKPHKSFRSWIRPTFIRKKKFWFDKSRTQEGILEFLWFGVSYR